jgi:hypothetical protein
LGVGVKKKDVVEAFVGWRGEGGVGTKDHGITGELRPTFA